MRRLLVLLGFTTILVGLFASSAFAGTWGNFDVSNDGRAAKVWEQTRYDGAWNDVRPQLNNLAGEHGVKFNNRGTSGTAGVDWEVHLIDEYNSSFGGSDSNYTYCNPGCRSYSLIKMSTYYNTDKHGPMRHEFLHSLSAPHSPCSAVSIMHGYPYWPCAKNYSDIQAYDKQNYADNKARGVYDETMGGVAGMTTLNQEPPLTEDTVVKWAKFNADKADEVHIMHKHGGILVKQVYYPHVQHIGEHHHE